jgi:inner membrane protein
MATPLSHLAVPLALGAALGPDLVPPELLALALVCAALPDVDALGLWLGIPYAHPLGHRGLTHSLPFAAVLAASGAAFAHSVYAEPALVFCVLFASAASHGLPDAMTDGGLGVALFSPFSQRRHFLRWRVIAVSPLRPSAFFSRQGLAVLVSEARWVWAPCAALAVVGGSLRGLFF